MRSQPLDNLTFPVSWRLLCLRRCGGAFLGCSPGGASIAVIQYGGRLAEVVMNDDWQSNKNNTTVILLAMNYS